MKRIELIKKLTKMGCFIVRHGSNHDWYTNYETGQSQPVPRHREIKDHLAKSIIKRLRSDT